MLTRKPRTVLVTNSGPIELKEREAQHLHDASRAAASVRQLTRELAEQYGEPGSGVWPVAFYQVGHEAAQPQRETDSLVWVLGSRVVLETFSTNLAAKQNWSHRVIDFEPDSGDFVFTHETERGESTRSGNVFEEVHDYTNIPGVFIQQLENSLATIALAYPEYSDKPGDWPVRVEFE